MKFLMSKYTTLNHLFYVLPNNLCWLPAGENGDFYVGKRNIINENDLNEI